MRDKAVGIERRTLVPLGQDIAGLHNCVLVYREYHGEIHICHSPSRIDGRKGPQLQLVPF